MIVAMAVRRNTGATASWITRAMSRKWDSPGTGESRTWTRPASSGARAGTRAQERDRQRQEAHRHDSHDEEGEVLAHPRDVPEEVAGVGERPGPRGGAHGVVCEEAAGRHLGHAGHERDVGP